MSTLSVRQVAERGFLAATCVLAAGVVGCDRAADTATYDDPLTPARENIDQPADRIARLQAIHDRAEMPAIVDALDDTSPEVRAAAAHAAERFVGAAIPFHANAPPEKRAREIDAYRRLWQRAEETNTEFLIDLVPVLLDDLESDDMARREQSARDVVLLTGVTFGLKGDQPAEFRGRLVAQYRKLWTAWNQPGNRALQFKRGPNGRSRRAAQPP